MNNGNLCSQTSLQSLLLVNWPKDGKPWKEVLLNSRESDIKRFLKIKTKKQRTLLQLSTLLPGRNEYFKACFLETTLKF